MMRIYNNKLAVLLTLSVGWLSFSAAAKDEQKAMIKCHIQAPQSVKAGEKIPLLFKLSNSSDKKLALLKWNTPLEGWFGDSFTVTRDGQWVNYVGAMVKRFRPGNSDYARLSVGQSIEHTVNMLDGYQMNVAGTYKVQFKGRLQDLQVVEGEQVVSKQRTLQKVDCNEVTIKVL